MNPELEQQRKFAEQFIELTKDAPKKFKDKWDETINFANPSRVKFIPTFNNGAIDSLSVALREKYEILRKRYYDKLL
jgi:nucleoid-associated protein YejK